MIKLIIEETYSKPDVYGNRYWLTKITSTEKTDEFHQSMSFGYSDNTNNAKSYARESGLDWSEIHVVEKALPIREFDRQKKYGDYPYVSHDEVVGKIKELIK